MKTIQQLTILLIALGINTPLSQAQITGRNVNWVHGLNENSTAWDIYEQVFQAERKLKSFDADYNSNIGVIPAGTEVDNEWVAEPGLNGGGPTDPLNLLVGHSMGGVVGREIDWAHTVQSRRFGGIITVGSPNDGAYIINSVANGDVLRATNDALSRMSSGPASHLPLATDPIVQIVLQEFVQGLAQNIFAGTVLSEISAIVGTQTGADLQEGAAILTDLYTTNNGTPMISIWGNEQSPVHWRLLSSLISGNQNDTEVIDIADKAETIYTTLRDVNTALAVVSGIGCIFNPGFCIQAGKRAWSATQWQRGVRWLDESESIWVDLIGCNEREVPVSITYTETPYQIVCGGYYTGSPDWIHCINQLCFGDLTGPECAPYELTMTYTQIRDFPSDGLICQFSQIIDGIPPGNEYEAIGVNHSEELNTSNKPLSEGGDVMGVKCRDIFDRPVGDFFRTEPR